MNLSNLGLALTIYGSAFIAGIIAHYGFADGISNMPVLTNYAWFVACIVAGIGIGFSTVKN